MGEDLEGSATAYFKVLSQNYPRESEQNYGNVSHDRVQLGNRNTCLEVICVRNPERQ